VRLVWPQRGGGHSEGLCPPPPPPRTGVFRTPEGRERRWDWGLSWSQTGTAGRGKGQGRQQPEEPWGTNPKPVPRAGSAGWPKGMGLLLREEPAGGGRADPAWSGLQSVDKWTRLERVWAEQIEAGGPQVETTGPDTESLSPPLRLPAGD
jgi:hypothetical protein